MSEETQVQTPQLTEEQIQEKVKEIRAAIAAFTASHERYKLSADNRNAIDAYLNDHNLEWTEPSLHLAYSELEKAGKLDLYEASKLSEPPKEKTVEVAPPAINALAEQQRARQNLEPGVGSVSNREAFRKAAEKIASQKPSGGRFHL